KVRVCELVQPLLVTAPSAGVTVALPLQVSVAVALPRAASIWAAVGLQPRVSVVPVAVIAGPVVSTVQVTVREAVVLLPQVLVALKVRVCELVQPLLVTAPSAGVTVALPLQVSVAVALPRAASIWAAGGLRSG